VKAGQRDEHRNKRLSPTYAPDSSCRPPSTNDRLTQTARQVN